MPTSMQSFNQAAAKPGNTWGRAVAASAWGTSIEKFTSRGLEASCARTT